MKKSCIFKILFYLATTIICYCTAFIIKYFILTNSLNIPENPIFKLTYFKNTGAAFSFFENLTWFLIAVGFIALFFILKYLLYNTQKISFFKVFLLSTLSGGIAANLYERLMHGYVVDYIELKFMLFAVFNYADILIVLSSFALILIYYIDYKKLQVFFIKLVSNNNSFSQENTSIENLDNNDQYTNS